MFLYSIILGFIVGFVRKGKFVGLPPFKHIWILAVSFVLQVVQAFFHESQLSLLNSISYLVIFLFVAMNWNYDEIRLSSVGVFLNALPIWFNHGKMPVDYQIAISHWSTVKSLLDGTDFKHTLINTNTPFAIFGDIMYVRYPIGVMISIGDVLISISIFLLVLRTMDKPLNLKSLIEKLQT